MAVYTYTATNPTAEAVRGTLLADSPRDARNKLRDRGLSVHHLAADTEEAGARRTVAGHLGLSRPVAVSRTELSGFLRELSTLLEVGAPMLDALDIALKPRRARFRALLLDIRERVAAGMSLGEAMSQTQRGGRPAFDTVTLAMTRVGEDAGCLAQVLGQVASYHERGMKMKNRLTSALIYPAVVMTVGLGVCLFLMTYVVPGLLDTLIESGEPLPWITGVVKGASDFIVAWWWLIGLVAVLGVVTLAAVRSTPRGRWHLDRGVLAFPVVGELLRKQAVVRLAFVLSTLMRSGVGFERAIGIAQRSAGNRVLRDALHRCELAVQEGRDLGPALAGTGAFPDAVAQVFALGQASGRLEELLDRLASSYDRQVATLTDRLTALIEPVLIVFLALIVGVIAFATILPILEMGKVL